MLCYFGALVDEHFLLRPIEDFHVPSFRCYFWLLAFLFVCLSTTSVSLSHRLSFILVIYGVACGLVYSLAMLVNTWRYHAWRCQKRRESELLRLGVCTAGPRPGVQTNCFENSTFANQAWLAQIELPITHHSKMIHMIWRVTYSTSIVRTKRFSEV